MLNFISRIREHQILYNSGKLLMATSLSFLVGILLYPIISRLYTPNDFGVFGLFTGIGNILTLIATAEYHYAIVLPKDTKTTKIVFQICIILLFLTTILISCSLYWTTDIARLFKSEKLVSCYYFMPIFVFCCGLWNIINYYFIKYKQFTHISLYQICQSALSSTGKLLLGFAHVHTGLILSASLTPILALSLILSLTLKHCKSFLLHLFPLKNYLQVAKNFKKFPLFSLPKSLINALANNLPAFWLLPIFGEQKVGYWTMAVSATFIPVHIISKTLYQVFYQHITEKVNNKEPILRFFRIFNCRIFLIGIPLFVLIYFLTPSLVKTLLGHQWIPSILLIRWMIPWIFFTLIINSINFLFDIFAQQKIGFYFEMLTSTTRFCGLLIGILTDNFYTACIGYCLASFLSLFGQFLWHIHSIKTYERNLL